MGLLEQTIRCISPRDSAARKAARERIRRLTMPPWALGRICDLAVELAGISGRMPPPVARKMVVVMAGDHGVVDEGVSPSPRDVTRQMVANFIAGGAGVNVLARLNGAEVVVVDVGMAGRDEELVRSGKLLGMNVAKGTRNLRREPAMTRDQAVKSIETGIEIARRFGEKVDVFGIGEMGIGNTTPATAIASILTGRPVSEVCGKGAGLRPDGVSKKVAIIEEALKLHQPDPTDALDILAKVGGLEIGAMAGLVLGAAAMRKPVLVDGFISTSGAMLAKMLCPLCLDHFILAHASGEPGHPAMREWIGREPLLHLEMRLGEGTGAALAMNLVEAAARILTEMATFDSAGISESGPA
ncbi:MAG: nicotinate-nucleotide--dimethylbenzimidazole phosphoribosyltransferase [Planctomycetota bacterium]|jgi:nicotinate-nucleotide--dimethylbenzimidazole phosphoribosyltransferase|nr:nicotinate-nucleotide--dimethylbenzimidazole phosphoribosyltransferase [Planctomycetota bacterium]